MMLEIAAARENFEDNIILGISFVQSSQIAADGLRKCMQQKILQEVLLTGKLKVQPEQ